MKEAINHPKHYNSHPSGIEIIDVIEHLSFNVGNAIKYLYRAGKKDSTAQEYNKAIWYIRREQERLQVPQRYENGVIGDVCPMLSEIIIHEPNRNLKLIYQFFLKYICSGQNHIPLDNIINLIEDLKEKSSN